MVHEAEMRTVLGHFPSGVCIVTGMTGEGPAGLALQSFFSLSLTPPQVAISVAATSTSWPAIEGSGSFCVNVLRDDQEALCRAFARSGSDKFAGVGWEAAPSGAPRLDDVLAWVDCHIEAVHAAGDHFIVVGLVLGLGAAQGSPLVFYRGGFGGFRA